MTMTRGRNRNTNTMRKTPVASHFFYFLLIVIIASTDHVIAREIPAFIQLFTRQVHTLRRADTPVKKKRNKFAFPAANGEALSDNAMVKNQLMHVMLRVPNVNATVDFWTSRGANVHTYRKTAKAETAFVGFGPNGPGQGYFSLEITALGEELNLGNAVQYFGLSMLLGMDLKMAAAGEKPAAAPTVDPNGLEIRSVASAPGDSFARVCLRTAKSGETTSNMLSITADFYTKLGMEPVAADDALVCLRYTATDDDAIKRPGVATTLVFEANPDELDLGNCLDHLGIGTRNVDAAAANLQATLADPDQTIFMEPKPMFGTKIMGLYDPNGYKVYLVEQPQKQGDT